MVVGQSLTPLYTKTIDWQFVFNHTKWLNNDINGGTSFFFVHLNFWRRLVHCLSSTYYLGRFWFTGQIRLFKTLRGLHFVGPCRKFDILYLLLKWLDRDFSFGPLRIRTNPNSCRCRRSVLRMTQEKRFCVPSLCLNVTRVSSILLVTNVTPTTPPSHRPYIYKLVGLWETS